MPATTKPAVSDSDAPIPEEAARDRVAEFEAENAALRRALALADVEAAGAADRAGDHLLRERHQKQPTAVSVFDAS